MQKYELSEFSHSGRIHYFKKPLEIEVNYEEKEYLFNEPELGLLAIGKTFEECNKRLEHQIRLLWEEYVIKDNSNFSASANELRNKIKAMVK